MDNAHLHNPFMSASQSSNNSPNLRKDKAHTLVSSPKKNHTSALNLVWTDSESESEDPARKSTNLDLGKSLLWTGPEGCNAGMLAIWDGDSAAASDADVGMSHNNITTTIQGVEDNDLAPTENGNPGLPPRVPTPFPFLKPTGSKTPAYKAPAYKAPAYEAPVLPRSAACLSLPSLTKPCSSVLGAPSASTHEPSTWPVPAMQYMPASALDPNSPGLVTSPHRGNWNMGPPVLPRSAFPFNSSEQNSPGGLPLYAPKPATWHQPTLYDRTPSKAPEPMGVPLEFQTHSTGPVEPSYLTNLLDPAKSAGVAKLPAPATSSDVMMPPGVASWQAPIRRPGLSRDQQDFLDRLKQGYLDGNWRRRADEMFPHCRPATGWPDNIFTPKALLDLLTTPASPPPSPPWPQHAMLDPAKKPGPSMLPPVLPPGTGPVNILAGREQLLPRG
ncbi:hypothetical protein MAPG_09224, partial [Magnaporthiopsis poae ATCC 64411]